jgi:hypothetical protein
MSHAMAQKHFHGGAPTVLPLVSGGMFCHVPPSLQAKPERDPPPGALT